MLALAAAVVALLAGRPLAAAVPTFAALPLAVLAVTELLLARVVRDRVQRRATQGARPLHPESVARAAVLAKASGAGGALVGGGYAGVLVWALPRRGELLLAGPAALVAITAVVAAAALVAAALLLERACRTPASRESPGAAPG